MSYEYRYGLANRAAGRGSVPGNKPYRLEPPLADEEGRRLTRHGVIVYERPLSVDELYAFDLVLLADEDLKSALAVEIALELADSGVDATDDVVHDAVEFPRMVGEILDKIRLYRVYVGDLAPFSRMVLARLQLLADRREAEDAEVMTILQGLEPRRRHPASP
jgi:hypothetical protein